LLFPLLFPLLFSLLFSLALLAAQCGQPQVAAGRELTQA
jgi:hypothetical protein